MTQKAKAHRAPCGTWESTEADAHVQFIIQKIKIKVLPITQSQSQNHKKDFQCVKGIPNYNIIPY